MRVSHVASEFIAAPAVQGVAPRRHSPSLRTFPLRAHGTERADSARHHRNARHALSRCECAMLRCHAAVTQFIHSAPQQKEKKP
jgi:hypothetical protein